MIRARSRINHVYGALCNQSPCGADARQFHAKSAAADRLRLPRDGKAREKGPRVNYSARRAAPICGEEAGVIANSIISAEGERTSVVQEREKLPFFSSLSSYAMILRASPRKCQTLRYNDPWRIEGSSMLFSVNAFAIVKAVNTGHKNKIYGVSWREIVKKIYTYILLCDKLY